MEPVLESGVKTIGEQTKPGAKLSVRSIKSDTFEYKVKGGTLITNAKDKRYLETIRKILYYADAEDADSKKPVIVTNADKYEKIKNLKMKISKRKGKQGKEKHRNKK